MNIYVTEAEYRIINLDHVIDIERQEAKDGKPKISMSDGRVIYVSYPDYEKIVRYLLAVGIAGQREILNNTINK